MSTHDLTAGESAAPRLALPSLPASATLCRPDQEFVIRQAVLGDAAQWRALAREVCGGAQPQLSAELEQIAQSLDQARCAEVWVVEGPDRLLASVTLPAATVWPTSPVVFLTGNLFPPASHGDGTALALLRRVTDLVTADKRMAVLRIRADDLAQQVLGEDLGFACVGYQPEAHPQRGHAEVLYYAKPAQATASRHWLICEALPEVQRLVAAALANLHAPGTFMASDGGGGYVSPADAALQPATREEYDQRRMAARTFNPPVEISGAAQGLHGGSSVAGITPQALLAMRAGRATAGVLYTLDETRHAVRITQGFCTDNASLGLLVERLVQVAHHQLQAASIEIDVLLSATRLLITVEKLGFTPVAFLPVCHPQGERVADVVRLVKFRQTHLSREHRLTSQAQEIVSVVQDAMQDQSLGLSVIKLLHGLAIFAGLGEGELRKLARLFKQKLFQAGDVIFQKDQPGEEAYVVVRGQVEMFLAKDAPPVDTAGVGHVFGEVSFLDGGRRGVSAMAVKPSILLEMRRADYFDLARREPHIGLIVMRNIALELASRLRHASRLLAERQTPELHLD